MTKRTVLILLFCASFLHAFSQQSKPVAEPSAIAPTESKNLALNAATESDTKGVAEKESAEQKEPPQGYLSSVLHQSTLLGNWSGLRSGFSEVGFEFLLNFKSDNLANLAGGVSRGGASIQNIDLSLAVDAEKLCGWTGGNLFGHVIVNNGGKLNPSVGDAQMVSNIEGIKIAKLYELWAQQNLWDGAVSFLTGLYDLNTEFYVTRTSGLFLNGSHGIGKECSQAGLNGPSVFPNTALAFRTKVQPLPGVYAQAVAIDGVPGDPDDPYATSFHIDAQEGALLVAEFGYSKDESESDASYAKLAFGVWHFTSAFSELVPDVAGEAVMSPNNSGIYVLAEKKVLCEGGSRTRGLALFARGGVANERINRYSYHFEFGAVYTGLFSGREDDIFGVAIAHAHAGVGFRTLMVEQGSAVRNGELAIEMTYRAQLTPWLAVQPNFQHIIQPGSDAAIRDASVVGTRIEVKF
jgi:porin